MIVVLRTYFLCKFCRQGEYAADRRLGILGSLTLKARELICLAGVGCGFAKAAGRLFKFCGWKVSVQMMRRTCEREGVEIEKWREGEHDQRPLPASGENSESDSCPADDSHGGSPAADSATPTAPVGADLQPTPDRLQRPPARAAETFRQAEGEIEFSTDGTSVNTLDGWREIRIALWLKRPQANAAEPHDWGVRVLPKPTAQAVLIDMATAETFASRWREWLFDLGVDDPTKITVLADGAEWIWKQAALQFPGAQGVLDVYHASEHIAETARSLFGDSQGAVLGWAFVGTDWLIRDGWQGVCRWIAAVRNACDQAPAAIEKTEELLRYFAKHTAHLHYRERLQEGLAIGSGPVEGAAKQVVGRRLKQTGARWQTKNAIAMATLVSSEWADDWDRYWGAAKTSPGHQASEAAQTSPSIAA